MYFIEEFPERFVNLKDKESPETLRKGKFFVASILLFITLGIPYNIYSILFQQQLVLGNLITFIFLVLLFSLLFLYKKFRIRVLLVNVLTSLMFAQLVRTYSMGGLFSSDNLWCVVYSCWVFLVADKKSGMAWFGITLLYYVFLFYVEKNGLKDFKTDFLLVQGELTFINLFFGAVFMGVIIYLHEAGKDKYLNALLLAKVNIEEKSKELELQKKDIISSINYAGRIQSAVLPQDEVIYKHLPDAFIFYKPKNIVSGDFYFVKQVNDFLFIAAADCTGHGVPGSLMTILGLTFLNELVTIHQLTQSNEILDELRNRIKISLKQTGKSSEAKDGMDIALCVINMKLNTMQYSGAHNPLLQISNGQIIEHKADRMPIGIFPKERPFGKNEIDIHPNDIFYLFSDGFIDQFGGMKTEKFKSRHFKDLIFGIHTETMLKQKEALETTHNQWKAKNDQTDDILIIGFKYS